MSIASEITRINNNVAAAYTALLAKGATMPQTQNSAALADTIGTIPSGSTEVAEPAAIFYDYDGTEVYRYSKAGIAALSALPDQPVHAGLTAAGWNWTLAHLQSAVDTVETCINVGAYYTSSDGSTRIYIRLEDGETDFQFRFSQTHAGNTQIDWGDGSAPETFNTYVEDRNGTKLYRPTHTYSPASYPADYVVKMTLVGEGSYGFGIYNYNRAAFSDSTALAVRKLELAANIGMVYQYSFANITNLKSVAWNGNKYAKQLFSFCSSLKYITAGAIAESMFSNCTGLERVSIHTASIGASAFKDCWNLKSVGALPTLSSVGNNAFENCYELEEIEGRASGTSVGSSAFLYCYSLGRAFSGGTVGSNAYAFCYGIQKIVLKSSTTTIESAAYNVAGVLLLLDLTAFTDPESLPTLSSAFSSTFTGVDSSKTKIYVANEEMRVAFSNATNWSGAASYYTVAPTEE